MEREIDEHVQEAKTYADLAQAEASQKNKTQYVKQEKTEREQAAKKEKDLARQNAGFQSSFDQLLYEYPIQHLGLLSQSSILILIRSVMVYTKREGGLEEQSVLTNKLDKIVEHILLQRPVVDG